MTTTPPDQNVVEEEWDYLVVLDACRYDFFEELYDEYLDGTLEKRRSRGSATPEWAAKTFTDHVDLTYLSANPFINSLGIPLNELKWGASCEYDWAAADHIAEVVDLWREAWDDDLGAVVPEAVTAAARERLDGARGSDRMIVHYLQPHAPYLRRGRGRKLERIRGGVLEPEGAGENGHRDWPGVGALRRRFERRLGRSQLAMALGMLVELDPASVFDLGTRGLRRTIETYYEENLRLALAATSDLAADLEGRVVVTSDHGEAFGEQDVWEHHVETHIPTLVDVPWLVLD
ncbi:hypothetical protein HUG10_00055 [Halorarum halophilum]|uniref:PglZ domain-containing protein n=1 Tax=Halorarum halophilum TaxID=2743090 RepID=A0A7D5G9U9_9EURY|nr:hypothetical protein [Halobaculum halophilum]QLG26032.1 hypothetical protein HUG10_00055 [Halobaculum halophilum]